MTGLDPDNPVVKLCVAGMRAEGEGRLAERVNGDSTQA